MGFPLSFSLNGRFIENLCKILFTRTELKAFPFLEDSSESIYLLVQHGFNFKLRKMSFQEIISPLPLIDDNSNTPVDGGDVNVEPLGSMLCLQHLVKFRIYMTFLFKNSVQCTPHPIPSTHNCAQTLELVPQACLQFVDSHSLRT